jgi:signal transduction histidine kinase
VVAQEEERGRIARELHDETAQFLTALGLDLATLQKSLRRNPEGSRILERVQSLNQQMSRGIYRMVHDLRPAQLDDLGLVAALGYLADEARHGGVEVTLKVEGSRQRLEPLVETVLFRIAQEALSNVARHAKCNRAEVVLCFETHQVTLRVCDEGVGFNPGESRVPPRGWGLEGMRERAESVEARFSIDSVLKGGTHVQVVVPFVEKGRNESEEGAYEYDPVDVG